MTKDQKVWLNPSEGRRVSMGKYLRIQGSAANEIEKKIFQTIREFSKATGVTH